MQQLQFVQKVGLLEYEWKGLKRVKKNTLFNSNNKIIIVIYVSLPI